MKVYPQVQLYVLTVLKDLQFGMSYLNKSALISSDMFATTVHCNDL